LIAEVESGGCSGRVGVSASCCMKRSREEYCTNSRHCAVFNWRGNQMWWYWYEFPPPTHTHTHTRAHTHTRTHKIVCAQNSTPLRTYSVCSRPLTLLLVRLASVCLHFAVLTCNSFSVLIRLWCSDDKISWRGGWAIRWRPP